MKRWLATQACANGLEKRFDLRAQSEQRNERSDGYPCQDEAVLNQPLTFFASGNVGTNERAQATSHSINPPALCLTLRRLAGKS
jgi:hypothetical protein